MGIQRNASILQKLVNGLMVKAGVYDNSTSDPALNVGILQTVAKMCEQLSEIESVVDETGPIVPPRRVRKLVRVEEVNNPLSTIFDAVKQYKSDELPLWFRPLQAVIEDEQFTSMTINLGDRVEYRISIIAPA